MPKFFPHNVNTSLLSHSELDERAWMRDKLVERLARLVSDAHLAEGV